MIALGPPDNHHLRAAEGWLELGNPTEAGAELAAIAPHAQAHPDVLEVRWQVLAATRRWQESLDVAAELIRLAPERPQGWIHRAYALHELGRTLEARDQLLPVANAFPRDVTLRYNLACYECQLGHLEPAKSWFQQALALGDPARIKLAAAKDRDLALLREFIAQL